MKTFFLQQPKPNLTFRPVDISDICFIHEVRNSAREYLHDNRRFSLQDVIEFVVIKKPDWYIIESDIVPIYNYAHGKRIGYFRIDGNNILPGMLMGIGADIHPDLRGRGYGKQAYKQFISEWFRDGVKKFTLKVMADNKRALNLYLKLGFKLVKAELITRPGEFNDNKYPEVSLDMELDKEDWNG